MFSKALFKQSCKANGMMWAIITVVTCFILAIVVLVCGSGNITETKNAIQDTMVRQEIEAEFDNRAINYYAFASEGLEVFDQSFADNIGDSLTVAAGYSMWAMSMPSAADDDTVAAYAAKIDAWKQKKSDAGETGDVGKLVAAVFEQWAAQMPSAEDYGDDVAAYAAALKEWSGKMPADTETLVAAAYKDAAERMTAYITEEVEAYNQAVKQENPEIADDDAALLNPLEYVFMATCVLYPQTDGEDQTAAAIKEIYDVAAANGENYPEYYDVTSIISAETEALLTGKESDYVSSSERLEYRCSRAQELSGIFLAVNLTSEENIEAMIEQLQSYGIDREKYDSFGYDYDAVKDMAVTASISYRGRLDYERNKITEKYTGEDGQIVDEEAYLEELAAVEKDIKADIASSLIASLPDKVGEALKEVGELDLFHLVVGSIYYKLAGLLLPIIYMIMAANNLISGQVDSGSMAYILSTSTKRQTVVFTQAVYLVGSLFAMFFMTTVTGCACMLALGTELSLSYGQMILLNVGAFCVLMCLSGLCFFTSCWFDRSKRSMALGGGLSIFALVASMLGLFGSPILPSIVRMSSLNYFNYVTVISLFDVASITAGTTVFVWKLAILVAAGLAGYIAGACRFVKKDLPL